MDGPRRPACESARGSFLLRRPLVVCRILNMNTRSRQIRVGLVLLFAAVLVVGADYLGPRWLFQGVIGYRGTGTVVRDDNTPSGARIDVATIRIHPGSFGGVLRRDLVNVPGGLGRVALVIQADQAKLLDLSAFQAEVTALPRGWAGDTLPVPMPIYRTGMLDGELWIRDPRPALGEVWFVPASGNPISADDLRRGRAYTLSVNLNGGIEPAAVVDPASLPPEILVRIVIW